MNEFILSCLVGIVFYNVKTWYLLEWINTLYRKQEIGIENTWDEFIPWNTSPIPNGKFIFISHKSYEINWKYKEFSSNYTHIPNMYGRIYICILRYRIQICLGKQKMKSFVYYILHRTTFLTIQMHQQR